MDNNIEKRLQSLKDRLSYARDIFAGKHDDSLSMLEEKLAELPVHAGGKARRIQRARQHG